MRVSTVDYHCAGEPFRIVLAGAPELKGSTILEKRRWALENCDQVRRLVVNEPRGHADMYGCFVTAPEDGGADLGVVFFHNAGYSTACGHGTIALVTWAIAEARILPVDPQTQGLGHAPPGPPRAMGRGEHGRGAWGAWRYRAGERWARSGAGGGGPTR